MTPPVLRARGLTKRYRDGEAPVLEAASLELAAGELVVLTGPSGSGKSTLLAVLAGLDRADEGDVDLAPPLPDPTPAWGRLALVPQALGLLDDLPVDEAVGLPLRLSGWSRRAEAAAVARLLDELGLHALGRRLPSQISLGEQQRTAIGRALVAAPAVVLLDEPTAHQDARSAQRVLDVLVARARGGGAVLVATHDPAVLAVADRHLRLDAGAVVAA